eukprot:3312908-Pyramimonas_sp.AAC.1
MQTMRLGAQESRSRFGLSYKLLGNRAIGRDFLTMHAGPTLQQPACSTWSPGPAFPTCPPWVCPPYQPV